MNDIDQIVADLSDNAKQCLNSAMSDRYAGTWCGNNPDAMIELDRHDLFDRPPEDGGGEWGIVAPLNGTGLVVADRVKKTP